MVKMERQCDDNLNKVVKVKRVSGVLGPCGERDRLEDGKSLEKGVQ
jgi:hypothetical protein